MNYLLLGFFTLTACILVQFEGPTDHVLNNIPDVPVTVDIYGSGGNGFDNGTGGGSGSFIRAIVYSTELRIMITDEYSQVTNGEDVLLTSMSGNGMFGGLVGDQNVGLFGTIIDSQNGYPGTHKVCVGARCSISPCLSGCQGRPLNQQIISGSGGLAPYHISISGTILDNPECMNQDNRYLDKYYTTNLLNCCETIKCATDCAGSMDGHRGNGGSGSVNFGSGTCDGIEYTGNYCDPGIGGSGYIMVNYEDTNNDSEDIDEWIGYIIIAIIIAAIIILMGIMVACITIQHAKKILSST